MAVAMVTAAVVTSFVWGSQTTVPTMKSLTYTYMQTVQDWMLMLMIAVLTAIDILILLIYTAVGWVQGSLNTQLVSNEENPQSEFGVRNYIL